MRSASALSQLGSHLLCLCCYAEAESLARLAAAAARGLHEYLQCVHERSLKNEKPGFFSCEELKSAEHRLFRPIYTLHLN